MMRTLNIERFDGSYAYCTDSEKKIFAIEKGELPPGAKPGDILRITDDGVVSVAENDTSRGKSQNKKTN